MKGSTIGVFSVVALALIGGLVFFFVIGPDSEENALKLESDVERIKGTITVAGDNYLGYWFLTSQEFQQRLRQRDYLVNWRNDEANYPDRLEEFAQGKYDIIVLPVNSYLDHGQAHRYPGVIPVAISESKGADSIVAYKDRIVGQDNHAPTVNDLDNTDLRFCLTPDSPSSFLLNIATVHFGIADLRDKGPLLVATNGSQDAYDRLVKRECEVAVLWEPDVSKALAIPGVVTVFGSDQVSELIIDVFVVRRQLVADDPERVAAFFHAYFETLAYYSNNREQMLEDMAKNSGFDSQEALAKALATIAWFDLERNCRDWFDIPIPGVVRSVRREKIIDTITQVADVMVEVGDLQADPLQGNPYTITNQKVLTPLCNETPAGMTTSIGAGAQVNVVFETISDDEWTRLREIGKMKVVDITFASSTRQLTPEGARVVDEVATALVRNYPTYRVLVKGHTSIVGDEAANMSLSRIRAEIVKDYLETTYSIDANRLKALGVGPHEPLPRQRDESELSYRNRLPRVEFILLEDKR